METQQADKIAKLNDRFRGMALDVVLTSGVIHGVGNCIELLKAVEQFDAFNEDNDPYGEHDFGSLEFESQKVFFKIDYYDRSLSRWCDPLDNACRRTMTIMLASEY